MRMVDGYRSASYAGSRFAPSLTNDDKVLIDGWLASQRMAVDPDLEVWEALLLEDKPFFMTTLKQLLQVRKAEMVLYCASKLCFLHCEDVKREFPILNDQGVVFLLNAADPSNLGIYAGKCPILLNMTNRADVWRLDAILPDAVKIVQAGTADIVWSALREWAKKGKKLRQARERLTDLLSFCLAKA